MIIFVALGTCLYTGIKWTMDSVQSSIDREYETGKMHDFEINYPYGFEDDFIDDLKTLEDVSAAEGYYETYRFFEKDNKAFHIKIMSLTTKSKSGEIVAKFFVNLSHINDITKLNLVKIESITNTFCWRNNACWR